MATRPGITPQPVMATGLGPERPPLDDLLALIRRPAWQADALCIEYPEVNFFPARGEPTEPARAVCRACLVREECLAFALEHGLGPGQHGGHGVWAGTSARERGRWREGIELDVARERARAQARRGGARWLEGRRGELAAAWVADPDRSASSAVRAAGVAVNGTSVKAALAVKRELEEAGELRPTSPAA